ncbi:MAG: hypothetical protein HOP02_13510 [Methylococcaceae bacterium]|nr:hypothetical protein [Methylococcaceae bacterium]
MKTCKEWRIRCGQACLSELSVISYGMPFGWANYCRAETIGIYTSVSKPVIPAGMPESSHMDVNLWFSTEHKSILYVLPHYHPWLWIPASLPE